jgi:GNAT superfamily N-acetyltransferase
MDLSYRYANLDDCLRLRLLGAAAYGTYRNVLDDEYWCKLESLLSSESAYLELLTKSKCLICEANQEIVGMAFLFASGNPTEIFDAGSSYLRMVGVHPDFWGRGIGSALMQQCVDEATRQGEKTLALHTAEFMDSARHIYEKMGFRPVKELDRRLGKRYWLYQLVL